MGKQEGRRKEQVLTECCGREGGVPGRSDSGQSQVSKLATRRMHSTNPPPRKTLSHS